MRYRVYVETERLRGMPTAQSAGVMNIGELYVCIARV